MLYLCSWSGQTSIFHLFLIIIIIFSAKHRQTFYCILPANFRLVPTINHLEKRWRSIVVWKYNKNKLMISTSIIYEKFITLNDNERQGRTTSTEVPLCCYENILTVIKFVLVLWHARVMIALGRQAYLLTHRRPSVHNKSANRMRKIPYQRNGINLREAFKAYHARTPHPHSLVLFSIVLLLPLVVLVCYVSVNM